MNTAAILLMIVGCNGGAEDCRELPAPAPFYSSIESCEDDNAFTAARHADEFDRIFGVCASVDEALVGFDTEIVWDVTLEEGLTVAVEPMSGEEVYVLARTDEPTVHRH